MITYKKLILSLMLSLLLICAPAGNAETADELQTMQTFLNIMGSYFELIESTHEISSDAEKSAIFQLQKLQEIYEERGEKARAATVFRNTLKRTDNPAIRNAIYMLLSDNLKETGRMDEAIKLLQEGLQENIELASQK